MEGRWWTLLAACLATFMLIAYVIMVPIALGGIRGDLNASFGQLQ